MISIYVCAPAPAVFNLLAEEIKSREIQLVDDPSVADVFVSGNLAALRAAAKTRGKRQALLFGTNEPRWSDNETGVLNVGDDQIYIMNCFTRNVYMDHLHYLWVAKYSSVELLSRSEYTARRMAERRPAFCMASNHGNGRPFVIGGEDRNLYDLRRRLAVKGWERGTVEVFGSGWPEGVSAGGGRASAPWQQWEGNKLELGRAYLFNICVENTDAEYYVTEKLWHALMMRCLPVYFVGRTGIGEILPVEAMVNVEWLSPDRVCDVIETMSDDEYLDRLNSLLTKFNRIVGDVELLRHSRELIKRRFLEKIYSIRC